MNNSHRVRTPSETDVFLQAVRYSNLLVHQRNVARDDEKNEKCSAQKNQVSIICP